MKPKHAAILAIGLALAACSGPTTRTHRLTPQAIAAVERVQLSPAEATAMLNAYRASHNLPPVRLDPALSAMAQRQANAMVQANDMSHNVDGSFSGRIMGAGIDTTRAAENIGGGYYSLQEAMAGWRASSEHNANLLLPQATRFGIAIAKDPQTDLRVYWAMEVAAEPEQR
ncbi:CAP domain-containing protein [Methylovirgula sp. 4M-Z18]|uniref:CAP domain-containing protein n=1 Tax=Methylovirgula sp. 4M-Z18 TaxID=2293567 RepID=UPI00131424EB|nr:CAP domain-containing protein [Methylovirgula sp. 4M-Z18]